MGVPVEYCHAVCVEKLEWCDTVHERDGHTDTQTPHNG